MNDLIRRSTATNKTAKRYEGKAFDWQKRQTCVHMARYHLRQMGHKPPTMPDIRSAIGAKRALKQRGWNDCAAMLDSLLPRIAPAEMLAGDIAILAGDDGLGAIVICVGRDVMGWHSDHPVFCAMTDIAEYQGAWRV